MRGGDDECGWTRPHHSRVESRQLLVDIILPFSDTCILGLLALT
jgi:hypothetical protein